MPAVKSNYQASDIKVLEGLEPVRKRPGMYIGSTDTHGLHHLVKEILDNAVDEALAGYGKLIRLYRLPTTQAERDKIKNLDISDQSITVIDQARGIPVDIMEPFGVSALEIVMTKLHAGGKFEETAYKASGGLHGIGSSAVNALSDLMQIVVKRAGKYYYQSHSRGVPQAKVKQITEEKVLELFPIQAPNFVGNQSGTLVHFIPDKTIFSTTNFSQKKLIEIVKDRAYLMAGIAFNFMDGVENTNQSYYFEGGIRTLVEHLNLNKKALHDVFYVNADWHDPDTAKNIGIEVAMQYNDSYNEKVESYVNVIHTPDGGTHVNGFRLALGNVLRAYATDKKLIKENENFVVDDLREGLTAVIFVKMPANDLQFESQTKAKLNNNEAQSAVYQIFKDALVTFLEENPKVGKVIIEKIMLSARARMAARAAKDAVIRKGLLEGNSLPGKLADCQSREASESEIYIVEGDSAGGCFAGETKIALTDGRNLSFLDIIKEQQQGKKHYCYTLRQNGKVGIEKIINPRRTKQNATVIEITLDNGEKITCTPDHQFMLRNGEYQRADKLSTRDSLMPLYRKFSDINDKSITIADYEMVWDPASDSWLFTHVLADWYNRWQKIYRQEAGDHCHHLDFNKHNNNPDNLIRLSSKEHLSLHRKHIGQTLHKPEVIKKCSQLRKTLAFRKKMSLRMLQKETRTKLSQNAKLQWQDQNYKENMMANWKKFYQTNDDYRKTNNQQLNDAQQKYWSQKENRDNASKRVRQQFAIQPELRVLLSKSAKQQWQDQELLNWRSQTTKQQWTPEFRLQRKQTLEKTYYRKTLKALKLCEDSQGCINLLKYQAHRKQTNDKSLLRFDTFINQYFGGEQALALEVVANYNHKIKSIKKLNKKIDVYDIEVPHTHNFALASGIFVHNSAKQGRDRRFQAIFPLRGKILNTERARLDKIVASEELKNLVIALGAGIGETFNEEKLRYHRIILMNDADVDGEHITTLGLTFFYRHLPQIIEKGYLYVALPPLYKVTYGKETTYVYSDQELAELQTKIKENNPNASISMQRYKGLGEMNPEQLWSTTMNPKTRIIKKINIDDATKADQTFDILMGDSVPPRKKFIQSHAHLAELDI